MKKYRRNPTAKSGIGLALVIGAVAYFVWCAYYQSQHGTWSWTPWRLSGVAGLLDKGTVIMP